MDLNEAIQEHSNWKMRLRKAIQLKETLDVATIARDDCCLLGKWLHGESRGLFGGLGSHKECVKFHAEFHKPAIQLAPTINKQQYPEAEAMLGNGTPYTEVSRQVVMATGTLKREANL